MTHEQPLPRLDSEARDVRVASESFAPRARVRPPRSENREPRHRWPDRSAIVSLKDPFPHLRVRAGTGWRAMASALPRHSRASIYPLDVYRFTNGTRPAIR